MKRLIVILLTICLAENLISENYLINGGQKSRIQYRLTQQVEPAGKTKYLRLSFVVPQSFDSPTYKQIIEGFDLQLSPKPSKRKDKVDKRGNKTIEVSWNDPKAAVNVAMSFTAINETILKTLESREPFPMKNIPKEMKDYLKGSDMVQMDHPDISAKATSLVQGVKTEFDAVQRILTWIVDHMKYVTPPRQYDALYSFQNKKGNCQNYSHLAAAMIRKLGIPVRIVNGVTLKEPYTVTTPDGDFTFKMGQGRHSWVEIYFPDLGWVPFDPQQTELFVSNRFVRIEVGVDNEETVVDGMVRWRQAKGIKGRPRFQEVIEADFSQDNVQLSLEKQNYGPKSMLICPPVNASFQPIVVPKPPPPKEIPEDRLQKLDLKKAFLFGNLDFPKGVDFAFTRGPAESGAEDEYEMKKNFMVETAEYVTTKMTQYAQIVVLQKPLKLMKAGLALHKFGGNGQLWIDIMKDNNGKPGAVIATSDFMNITQLPSKPGYDWVDFDFGQSPPVLSPGKYWIGLGFTGSPIINWFYTYGKNVGPVDGTRYKGVYEENWSGALAYEFNYRVVGWTTQ